MTSELVIGPNVRIGQADFNMVKAGTTIGRLSNLYSITTNEAAIIALFRVINRYVGNLPPMPGVFPDYPAPVVRNAGADRELTMMRWGMPPPPRAGGYPVTNIRNTSSPHWRPSLSRENRCLVPANSFAEYAPESNPETGKKDVVWFALNVDRPCLLLRASGPNSEATGAPNPNQSPARILSMVF
jgi:putative SOS response-associated peptidase YedK